jgi:hypothetical protein
MQRALLIGEALRAHVRDCPVQAHRPACGIRSRIDREHRRDGGTSDEGRDSVHVTVPLRKPKFVRKTYASILA